MEQTQTTARQKILTLIRNGPSSTKTTQSVMPFRKYSLEDEEAEVLEDEEAEVLPEEEEAEEENRSFF